MSTISIIIHKSDTYRIKCALEAGLLTLEQCIGAFGGDIIEDVWVVTKGWWVRDEGGCSDFMAGDLTREEAAQNYMNAGDFEDRQACLYSIRTWRDGLSAQGEECSVDEECVDIPLNLVQPEPDCVDRHTAHTWLHGQPRGHNGGIEWTDRCATCGIERHTDTWAQDSSTGRLIPGDVITYTET